MIFAASAMVNPPPPKPNFRLTRPVPGRVVWSCGPWSCGFRCCLNPRRSRCFGFLNRFAIIIPFVSAFCSKFAPLFAHTSDRYGTTFGLCYILQRPGTPPIQWSAWATAPTALTILRAAYQVRLKDAARTPPAKKQFNRLHPDGFESANRSIALAIRICTATFSLIFSKTFFEWLMASRRELATAIIDAETPNTTPNAKASPHPNE